MNAQTDRRRSFVRRMAKLGRRAAGTRTILDTWRAWLRMPASTPAKDIQDLNNGKPLIVSAILCFPDTWRWGALRIATSEDPQFVWFPRRAGAQTTIGLPANLLQVRLAYPEEYRYMKALHFRVLEFTAERQTWKMAVPTIDVRLMRHAFASVRPTSAEA
jgi:hypothetical protein